jgi:septal ring-binding cell division protein DamX/type II secretory pathway predicted ATPase ExeA
MKSIQTVTSPFINIGERSQQLDMIQHVQEFSAMSVLVTGTAGVGKTSFINAAIEHLSVHHQVLSLDALNTLTETNLIEQVSQQLGCGHTLSEVDVALAAVAEQGESVHLVIDDAHLLEDSALNLLFEKSLQEKGWHLVLCGDESLQERLNLLQAELQKENIYHLIHLNAFDEAETGLFIQEVYDAAGQDFKVLSNKKKHQLWLLSKGLPGKLLELLDSEKETSNSSVNKFPIGHVAAILLIGVALVLSFIYQDPVEPIAEQDVIAELLAQKVPAKTPHTSNATDSDLGTKQATSSSPVTVTDQASKVKVPSNTSTKSTPSASSLVVANKTKKVVTPASQPKLPKIERVASSSKSVPKKHPLLLAPPQEYALQLLGVRNKKSALAFTKRFARQLSSDKLNVYETTYKGQPWFVVVYGPYQNKKNASNEAVSLSRSLKSQPWVRPISKIQEDIRKIRH